MGDLTPVNYDVAVANPFQAAMQGYAAGAAVRDDQAAQQQKQLALQQQQQQAQVLNALIANPNPTATDYAHATLLVPGMKDQIKQSWDALNADQQQNHLSDAAQYYAAIQNGNPEIAVQMMNSKADAMDAASGAPTAQSHALRTQAQLIGIHPELAARTMGMMLANIPGGDKVISSMATLGKEGRDAAQAPGALAKVNADASKAQSDATVAAGTVPALIAKPGIDNAKSQQEIAASQAQQAVAALSVQIAQANSETERGKLTLQRDEWQQKADLLKSTSSAGATTALDTINNMRSTLDAVMKHPGLTGFFGAGTAGGSQLALIPGTDAHDFRAMLDTLKSQQFLQQLDALKATSANGSSGLGALSNSEGDRLAAAIANLDPNQSQGQLKTQLTTIGKLLDRAQAKLIASGKAPGTTNTGAGAVVMTHPTYGAITDARINALLQQNPGATREQVLQFLQSQTPQPGQ